MKEKGGQREERQGNFGPERRRTRDGRIETEGKREKDGNENEREIERDGRIIKRAEPNPSKLLTN